MTVLSALLTVSSGFARTADRIFLQSGQVLEGYISEQKPGREVTVTTENGTRTFKWSDIVKTEKILDGDGGIVETVSLKSGDIIRGRIVIQNIGKDLVVETSDGERQTVSLDDIAQISSDVADEGMSVWKETPFLDRIILNDSTSVEGFIVSRRMGESVSILGQYRFKPRTYQLSDIACYQKIENGEYEEDLPDDVAITVDGKDVSLAETDIMFDQVRVFASAAPQFYAENPVTVEVRGLDIAGPVSVYRTREEYMEDDVTIAFMFNMSDKPASEASVSEQGGERTVLTVAVKKSGLYYIALGGYGTGIMVELYK